MKTMKTVNEILEMVNETSPFHFRDAKILQSMALTEFAKIIERKGGKILTASPKSIKYNGNRINVIGSYIKYTYDNIYVHYFQFDENPFFPQMGYVEYYTHDHRISTGLTEVPHIWDNVNAWEATDENIKTLTNNLINAEKYLNKLSFVCRDKFVSYRDTMEQEIYVI